MNRSVATLCAILLLAVMPASVGAQQDLQKFATDRLSIETADGRSLDFEVELALTAEQRAQGLMFRRDLPDMGGMLFIYDKDWDISMWMKNTVIPLDMLFIKRDGRIVAIAERAVPFSLETISSGQPASGVLEINGGAAARLGIHPGDRVRHSAFTGAP
ncbi:MAG TPA: DUF192 domain-containing protein [Kiloniellales bacterium]|jgi:hypothetical protein